VTAGYTTTFTTVDNPPGSKSAAVAVCPTGTRLLSGGTLSTADTTDVQLLSAWPPGPARFKSVMWNGSATEPATQWLSEVVNQDPAPATMTIYAICAA
jgi:hypothetical protein